MNIKLTNVLSQVQGVSGIKMIEAIIAGERDTHKLLLLCDKRIIKQKSELVLKALEGNYNSTWLFMLEQNLTLWKLHEKQIVVTDQKIDQLLKELAEGKPDITSDGNVKSIRHHKPQIKNLHEKMLKIYGVNANMVPGITDYSLLRLLGETGTDMSRFPTEKHFVSWCQLSPGKDQSGKYRKRIKIKMGSKAGQIFREAAQSLINSKHVAIGAFIRRLRGRKDAAVAIKAGAAKIAKTFYNLLTKGKDYVEEGVKKYEELLLLREKKNLQKLALKHNMQLVEIQRTT